MRRIVPSIDTNSVLISLLVLAGLIGGAAAYAGIVRRRRQQRAATAETEASNQRALTRNALAKQEERGAPRKEHPRELSDGSEE